MSPERSEVQGDPLERITDPHPAVQGPITPPPVDLGPPAATFAEQAMSRLNEAAQHITDADGNRRAPRASRLSPMRDISADIQRESTPMPIMPVDIQLTGTPTPSMPVDRARDNTPIPTGPDISGAITRPPGQPDEDLSRHLPDLWPWLQDSDTGEHSADLWTNHTDPLISRRVPTSVEGAAIEAEDIRRALATGAITAPLPALRGPSRRVRVAFSILIIMNILALTGIIGTLISVVLIHPYRSATSQAGPPTLTLSSNVAALGQTITLHITHFFPSTRVLLTHDVQEPVQAGGGAGSSLVKVDATGSVNAAVVIDTTWTLGSHVIQAEDVTTRYTASATLQITGAGPSRPPHFLIDGPAIVDMGTDYQDTNTIQTLTLHNMGSGSISWQGSSDQPWLMLSPPQGIFSAYQTISIAAQRANLKPGNYKATLTFFSHVSSAQYLHVIMTVRPLPANAGPILEATPAASSFTATDGGADPTPQPLTVANPGTRPLNWSLNMSMPPSQATQSSYFHALGTGANWLNGDQISGVIAANSTSVIHLLVHSRYLLPGVYTGTLVFSGQRGTLDPIQNAVVSLTIEPRCGLLTSLGNVAFTTVVGQSNPGNQTVNLTATSSCPGTINWQAVPSVNWLSITPANGQLRGAASTISAIGVNALGLKAGIYSGTIAFVTGQNTQAVTVRLIVQPPPPPTAPIMAASPLSLNFNSTQGQGNPPSQDVTITNTGGGPLHWHTSVTALLTSWLNISPSGGTIDPTETGQLMVNINTGGLTPGTYLGQITLYGTDRHGVSAAGSPQVLSVSLQVLPPCALTQPSLSALAFSAVQGGPNPQKQSVTLTASGTCNWPLQWNTSVSGAPAWLTLKPTSGPQAIGVEVDTSIAGLSAGTYTSQISISATDSSGIPAQGSPQKVSVTLTVLPPCTLQVPTASLAFTAPQGSTAPPGQSLTFNAPGNCVTPVTWKLTSDQSWLVPPASGTFDGTGSATVQVNVNPATLAPGTYNAQITVAISDASGRTVQNSPQTVAVKLTVTPASFSISGTVTLCVGTGCTPTPPTTATLTLMNGATQVAMVTADASGNYTFSNIPQGTYTLNISATDSGGTTHLGTNSITVTGNQTFNVSLTS
ncbi:MAG: hypothetical protein ABI324_02790 [Ktedonobacteraceae bacterium]